MKLKLYLSFLVWIIETCHYKVPDRQDYYYEQSKGKLLLMSSVNHYILFCCFLVGATPSGAGLGGLAVLMCNLSHILDL